VVVCPNKCSGRKEGDNRGSMVKVTSELERRALRGVVCCDSSYLADESPQSVQYARRHV